MTTKSKEFEQLIARITALLQGTGAKVEWDVFIPDPHSPSDPRQIDVLITHADGKRSSVECRERAGAQCVMWIEELIGRKISLGLDGMIAVACNGFSALAKTKAAQYGIVLYDFDRLTDEEIASWGSSARVEAEFVQFSYLAIVAGIASGDEARLNPDTSKTSFRKGAIDGFVAIMDELRDEVALKPRQSLTRVLPHADFSVDGVRLTVLACTFEGDVVSQVAASTYVALVDAPGVSRPLRSTSVQRFEHSVPEVIQYGKEAHLLLDASKIQPPRNAILHQTRVTFPAPTSVTKYELIGSRHLISEIDRVALTVATI